MDHKLEHRAPRPNYTNNFDKQRAFSEFDLEDLKRNHRHFVSPSSQSPSQSPPHKASPAAAKRNCLCSPTTHVGSFRCRRHRHSPGMLRGGSVGSNLADLGRKSDQIMESSSYSP